MKNPWHTIPLSDYEAHMELPTVGQAALIADEFARVIESYKPSSAAVLGCAGGNGLDRVEGSTVRRLVAVDINPDFAATTLARYRERIDGLKAVVADVQSDAQVFEPVDLVFAALLFEYVDLKRRRQASNAGLQHITSQSLSATGGKSFSLEFFRNPPQ